MLNKIKKQIKTWRYGRVIPANEALTLLHKQISNFWVINNSHVINQTRADLVFSNLPPVEEPVEQFPWPPVEDWAHRMHKQNQSQENLLARLKMPINREQFVLRDTWLPQDVLDMLPVNQHKELVNYKDFVKAIVDGHVLVVSEQLRNTMFRSDEGDAELKRLDHIESLKFSAEHRMAIPCIYTDEQLETISVINERGTIDLKHQQHQQFLAILKKYTD